MCLAVNSMTQWKCFILRLARYLSMTSMMRCSSRASHVPYFWPATSTSAHTLRLPSCQNPPAGGIAHSAGRRRESIPCSLFLWGLIGVCHYTPRRVEWMRLRYVGGIYRSSQAVGSRNSRYTNTSGERLHRSASVAGIRQQTMLTRRSSAVDLRTQEITRP